MLVRPRTPNHDMKRFKWSNLLATILLSLTLWPAVSRAATLFVPNSSFEIPTTVFAGPEMDAWQKSATPPWYPTNSQFAWDQLTGQFLNTTNGAPDHIDNMDEQQGAFLFALPEVAIFQDFNTVSGSNTAPSHLFNAQYEAGKSYALTVGVLGGGGGMSNGATLEVSFYYRDLGNNMVTVGATTITNSSTLFPMNTHLLDFQVKLPVVKPDDAWAGKRIGIRIASTVDFALQGGYWDVDNVRLTESVLPNYSFETPATPFAGPEMDAWQKSPRPGWYPPESMFPWDQLMGQFLNTPYGASNHIVNMEGSQAAFLFALPEVFIFQDYNSLDGTNTTPSHNFNATFEAGKSYALTVGLLGNGGGMPEGVAFEISLYYRDAASNMVTVAATTITNSSLLFPTNTHFTDFQVAVPTVKSNDAWAGKHIGIKLASQADSVLQGGYWDVDNVRLTESVLPNNSFEFPANSFADPAMDNWQKSPQPFWYPGPFPWDQLVGQFVNPTNGAPDHIDNMDGRQAAFLFALPEVAIFQDYTTLSGTNTTPSHDFAAVYETGKSYNLTVGVLGGGGGMSNGVTLELSLYYRDAGSNLVTVATTTITNSADLFPTNTHFTDFEVIVPTVKGGEPWAGKYIGVRIASTVGAALSGGYWDVDNVRLQAVREPVLKNAVASGGQFSFTLDSAPGRLEILTSTNIALPASAWTSLGAVTNSTGSLPITDTNAVSDQRYYQVRQIP